MKGMLLISLPTLATQKLNASIGFHEMAFEDMLSTVLDKADAVRRSKRITERSAAQEARMDVSIWLNDNALIVLSEVGQWSVWRGVPEERERS